MVVDPELVDLAVRRILSTAFYIFSELVDEGLWGAFESEFVSFSEMGARCEENSISVKAFLGPNILRKMVLNFEGLGFESGYQPTEDEMKDVAGEFLNMVCGDLVTSVFGSSLNSPCSYSVPSSRIGRFSLSDVRSASGEVFCFSDFEKGFLCLVVENRNFLEGRIG